MVRSRYDDLHDQYYSLASSKTGTRFECLVAVVFKKLHTNGTVIHDLKLVGDVQVKHQIDITIERQGTKRRILIECKDFDVSGKKVGLAIVGDFSAAVGDLNPDEAYIVTCTGFTKDARKFARAKGIKTAILRTFQESDWEKRVRKIVAKGSVITCPPSVAMRFATPDDDAKLRRNMQEVGLLSPWIWPSDPVYFVSSAGRIQAYEFIDQKRKVGPQPPSASPEYDVDVTDLSLEIENKGPMKLTSLKIGTEVPSVSTTTTEIGGDKIALLILNGVGTEDAVVWDEDLNRFRLDKGTGEITTN